MRNGRGCAWAEAPVLSRTGIFARIMMLVAVSAMAVGAGCRYGTARGEEAVAKPARPAQWAQPVELAGCPNLHKVSDDLYRGAQPTAEGMKGLAKLGIKMVVSLRSLHSDKGLMEGLGLNYVEIPMVAWHAENEDIVAFLKVMAEKKNGPVFVHCQHGSDRTGMMCAIYRIAVQGWSKEDASKEMTEGGYGFHEVWQNLLKQVEKVDIGALKKKAGMGEK